MHGLFFEAGELLLRIARAGRGVEGKCPRQRIDLLLRQLDVDRRAVLLEIGAALGAGNGHAVRTLREQSGERTFAGAHLFAAAIFASGANRPAFLPMLSGLKRGCSRQRSLGNSPSSVLMVAVRMPRPRGA